MRVLWPPAAVVGARYEEAVPGFHRWDVEDNAVSISIAREGE